MALKKDKWSCGGEYNASAEKKRKKNSNDEKRAIAIRIGHKMTGKCFQKNI